MESDSVQMKTPENERGGKRELPASVEQQINENLRLLYQQHLQQDLPDRLKDLVARLRAGEDDG